MIGVAIKLLSSEFDSVSNDFKTSNSVVYLCHDIKTPDILHLSTIINHFVRDDSLEKVFNHYLPVEKEKEVPEYLLKDIVVVKNEDISPI